MRRLVALTALLTCALCCFQPARADAPKSGQHPTVAVLYFDYTGKDEQLAVLRKGLAQMLTSDLSALDAVTLVERDRLEEVLAELKLGESARIDPKSASKVGKLLGARYLVLGSYFVLMNSLRADARLVEVETGKVVQSVGQTGKPEDFLGVEQALGAALGKSLGGLVPTAAEAPRTAAVTPRRTAKPPAQLKLKTAVRYSKALDAIDHGHKDAAKAELAAVKQEQPDFQLAALDLDRLMR